MLNQRSAMRGLSSPTGEFTLKQVRAFVAIVETGSFTGAARQLFQSQPTLSRSIRELEDALGGSLFTRTQGGAVLSETGHRFLSHARRLLEVNAEMLAGMALWSARRQGCVKLMCSDAVMPAILPPLLRRLGASYSHSELEITDGGSAAIVEALLAGRIDLGVCVHQEGLPPPLLAHPLLRVPAGLLCTSGFRLPSVIGSLSDLQGVPLGLHGNATPLMSALLGSGRRIDLLEPAPFVSTNIAALYAMAGTGRMAAFTLATCTAHDIARGLVFFPTPQLAPRFTVSLVTRNDLAKRHAALELLLEACIMEAPWDASVERFARAPGN